MQLRGTIDDIIAIFNRVQNALPTIKAIALDPAFPQVVTRVQTLYDLAPTSTTTTSSGTYTSKLAVLIKPLDALIYLRRNPWAFWLGAAGIVAVIGGIGYRMGQRSAPR